ncbi:SpoIIE family protein phosphatase [Nocardia sp. CDC159]|uniref:SpoIIE family protein phosphatase n=1 Tax=Nocardia pulmonis TaxID=2951408 RepID=A0A9X2E150_9NOCA|nr:MULTISPECIES: SpoIIE family protein phosphatase [Nocardia]MCM6772272.1 SpoIIE family protein phosphatase [Nocardia pulmonis]MCM6785070.1 SpoIIE family protein phosphatase [Nocardia sp. CDC159]
MSTVLAAFREAYANALRLHLDSPSQITLAEGYELGRRALVEGVSILDLTEHHFRLLDREDIADTEAALEFLLQTLAALDVATRGFLDSTRSYELQRLRAEDLADRDAFRTALVESLQDGFFVADARGTVTEVNSAFGALTGYGPEGVPYKLPHPWSPHERSEYPDLGTEAARFVMPIRHRDGRRLWLAVSTSSVLKPENEERVYVGTIRDVTSEHDAQARDQAVSRLATAVAAATTVAEVLSVGLEELRRATDAETAVVSVWPNRQGPPNLYVSGPVAGSVNESDGTATATVSRQVLDARARALLDRVRTQPGRSVFVIPEGGASSEGIVAPLGEAGDAALWLRFAAPRAIGAADRVLFSLLVGHLSLAVQRARNFDQARATSLTLQRAMLGPIELPPRFSVHYEPALPPLEIGGDWYDVVQLRDGAIGIVVGDCVGRGLSAAVVMGQLRTAARALLLRGAGPAQLLAELDTVAARIPGAMCTTVCAAVLDPARGTVRYSSAGHMPPVLAEPNAKGKLLEGGRAVPLATFDPPRRPEATTALAPGSTLVLFTDGLVEQRGIDIDMRFDELADELSSAAPQLPREVADAVLSRLRPAGGYDDDVAMVVYRQPPRALHIDVPAEPHRLAAMRRELTTWLAAAAVPQELAADLVAAANEACSNSIEHAYLDGSPGRVALTADCTINRVTLEIADTGSWRPQPEDPGNRGRGIAMMRALSDELTIDHVGVGTRVRMVAQLPAVSVAPASRI